jgi:hypothetical protein
LTRVIKRNIYRMHSIDRGSELVVMIELTAIQQIAMVSLCVPMARETLRWMQESDAATRVLSSSTSPGTAEPETIGSLTVCVMD